MPSPSPWQHHRNAALADDIDLKSRARSSSFSRLNLIQAKVPSPRQVRWFGKTRLSE